VRACVCVCGCVCERERGRERERAYVCVCICVYTTFVPEQLAFVYADDERRVSSTMENHCSLVIMKRNRKTSRKRKGGKKLVRVSVTGGGREI